MPFFVYILQSQRSNTFYTGQTCNLANRVKAHNDGLSPYTKGRGLWKLVYFEEYSTRSEAMKREKFLKSGKGRELIKVILRNSD
jgi:putative endonuclease